jgi:ribosomal protein S18 acetylase RimI-like enzyme
MRIDTLDSVTPVGEIEKQEIVDFLYKHLQEFRDEKPDIRNALEFALNTNGFLGGYVLKGYENDKLAGVVLVNKTGMKGYIPENILVYIAVDENMRGQGIGKQLMKAAVEKADGDVALHVEPHNPARFLYEKIGFTNKYLEYRYKKKA